MRLLNARTGQTLADRIELATTRRERRRGLLGRRRLPPGFALVLRPCAAIHTAFMQCAIDVIFVDRQWRTVRIARHLRPWRIRLALRARSVIELPAGALSGVDLACGDRVALVIDK
jgi:uncharacterized membrane protein (UPF0127 family)